MCVVQAQSTYFRISKPSLAETGRGQDVHPPRLTHCLRLGVLPKGELEKLDSSIRWRVKGVFNLPVTATNHYLYAPTAAGGVGLTHFVQEADILLVAAMQRLT